MITIAYWQPIRGISDPVPIRAFNGVYKPDDEGFNLSDDLFTELINFGPDNYPAISTRSGYAVLGTYGTRVLGLGSWQGIETHAVFNDGTWRKYDGSSWTTLATGLSASAEWSFCNFQGNLAGINLIGSNGVDPIKRYDGSTVQDLANAPAGGNFITTQSNRLYCADGNYVKYSALNEADDWITVDDAGELPINSTDGGTIVGLSPGNGYVIVFKPGYIREIYGKGPLSYETNQVASDIGATSNKAIATFDEAVPFIARNGIYQYAGGLRPSRDYSGPVQQFMNGLNKAQLSKCVAGGDGNYLYFGVPYGAAATENSRILQFDQTRGGWYTWDGIAVTQMMRASGDNVFFGDASGRVLQLGGTTDGGAAITATGITKPFTSGSIARKQQWFKLWVVASILANSTLSIYISGQASGENWTLAKTLSAATDMQFQEILIPTNTIAAANAVRLKLVAVGPVTIHEITRQLRQMPMRR